MLALFALAWAQTGSFLHTVVTTCTLARIRVNVIFIHWSRLTREGVETNLAQAYMTTGRSGQVNPRSWWLLSVESTTQRATMNTFSGSEQEFTLYLVCWTRKYRVCKVTWTHRSKVTTSCKPNNVAEKQLVVKPDELSSAAVHKAAEIPSYTEMHS